MLFLVRDGDPAVPLLIDRVEQKPGASRQQEDIPDEDPPAAAHCLQICPVILSRHRAPTGEEAKFFSIACASSGFPHSDVQTQYPPLLGFSISGRRTPRRNSVTCPVLEEITIEMQSVAREIEAAAACLAPSPLGSEW